MLWNRVINRRTRSKGTEWMDMIWNDTRLPYVGHASWTRVNTRLNSWAETRPHSRSRLVRELRSLMPNTLIFAPNLHFGHVAGDVQQDEVVSKPLWRNAPVGIAPPRDEGFLQGGKEDRVHDRLWLFRACLAGGRDASKVLDVRQVGEVREEWGDSAGWDELVAHDAEMGELAEKDGAFGCDREGGVPAAGGHEEGEVGAAGVAVV